MDWPVELLRMVCEGILLGAIVLLVVKRLTR
jgi:hypothetical protein